MKNPIHTKKGQVFTWDLAISISIFLIVIAMIFYMWDASLSKMTETKDIYEMESIATEATEQLIRTPGIPRDWEVKENGTYKYNNTNITAIGLANIDPRVLNGEKILRFTKLNYSDIRPLLGTRRYDFYFNMDYLNGTPYIFEKGTVNETPAVAGIPPSSTAFEITARRTAILDDEIIRIYFKVWTNKSYAPTAH